MRVCRRVLCTQNPTTILTCRRYLRVVPLCQIVTICSCEDKYSENILLNIILELTEINCARSSCNHTNSSLCQDSLYIEFNNSNTQRNKTQTHNVTTPHALFFIFINEGVNLHRKYLSFLVSWTCVI